MTETTEQDDQITFAPDAKVTAKFETSMGNFVCQLFADQCPKTVANFVGLATGKKAWHDPSNDKEIHRPLYEGTIFHRVIKDFMIQGGDPLGNGTGGPGYQFEDEFDPTLKHDVPGVLSMANSGPNTNGSQFFITQIPTPWLDGKHSVFGKVIEGFDIVEKIANAAVGRQDRPNETITLQRVIVESI